MKKQLLILMMLCISMIGYSQTFIDNNFIEYTVIPSTNNVEVTDYDFANGGTVVDIPATVMHNSTTYNVTEIGDEAFLAFGSTEKITSVVIPNGVTTIGYRSFQSNLLTSVTIPDSVTVLDNLSFGENLLLTSVILSDNLTSIAQFAFVSCALTNVNIPSGVTLIGSNAFSNNQLTSVTIPSNVTVIETRAFYGNPLTCVISENTTPPSIVSPTGGNVSTDSIAGNRSNIDLTIPTGTASAYAAATWTGFNSVAEGLTSTFVVDNMTYQVTSTTNNTVKTTNYNMAGGTVVNIPETVSRACVTYSVAEISGTTFSQTDITSVTIPTSVTVIANFAFANNTNLVSAPLHNGITSIGQGAFNNCALTSVNVPTSMTTIEPSTFATNNITSVTIPNNITSIGDGAFNGNPNLTNAQLHNGITSIGQSAFNGCNINSINIPTSMTTLENFTFAFNDITSVTIPDNITIIGNSVFTSNNITNLSLSNNLLSIGNQAFVSNQISSVIIPTSVTTIGTATFRSNQLTSVTIPVNVTTIGAGAFNFNPLVDVFSEATTPSNISTTGDSMDTFSQDRSTIHLHIPAGTMGAYVTDAGALWTGFNPVTEDALSISEFELGNNLTIITTQDAIELSYSNNIRLQNYALYTISGANVATGTESKITTSSFANGIYILKLDFDKGTVVKKVVLN